MNLYGFAAGDPINFSDPFGLCVQGGDPEYIKTKVTVDCGGGKTEKRSIKARKISEKQMGAVRDAAGRLEGGAKGYRPQDVEWAYDVVADRGELYSFPALTPGDKRTVLDGAVTMTGGGDAYVAFREDVLDVIVSGALGRKVGNRGINAANVVGHEGSHLLGARDNVAYSIKWRFRP